MYIKRPRRRMRSAGVASAIFAVGAGIGWISSDLFFGDDHHTAPTVAAIRFGDGQADAIPATQRDHDAALRAPSSQAADYRRYQHPDSLVRVPDEEVRLAQALQWAERYRQRQEAAAQSAMTRLRQDERHRLAAAEGRRWAELAEQTTLIRQPQADLQQLISADQHSPEANQPVEERISAAVLLMDSAAVPATSVDQPPEETLDPTEKVAGAVLLMDGAAVAITPEDQPSGETQDPTEEKVAGVLLLMDSAAVAAVPKATVPAVLGHVARCENCDRGPVRKRARVVRRAPGGVRRVRGHRRAGYNGGGLMCPLRWLESAIMGERRSAPRYARRHGAAG